MSKFLPDTAKSFMPAMNFRFFSEFDVASKPPKYICSHRKIENEENCHLAPQVLSPGASIIVRPYFCDYQIEGMRRWKITKNSSFLFFT